MTALSGDGQAATPGDRERRLDAVAHRIDTAIGRFIPYVGLAIGLALTPPFLVGGPVWPWVVIWTLVPVTVLWCAMLATVEPVRAERPVVGAVYMGGQIVLMAALTYASPLFAFMAIGVYLHAFAFLRGRWRFVAVVLGAVIVAYSQVGGRFGEFTPGLGIAVAVLTLANSLIGGGFT